MKTNSLRTTIDAYRQSSDETLLQNFKMVFNGKESYEEAFDQNYWSRKELIYALYDNYTANDKPLIKWLLQEEMKGFEYNIPVYTLDICAFMLYKHLDLKKDLYDLFEAKFATGTDARVQVDIELLFGFDKEETKNFLENYPKNKRQNKRILKAIVFYEANPNAKFKNRIEYINYFETKKILRIKNELSDMQS